MLSMRTELSLTLVQIRIHLHMTEESIYSAALLSLVFRGYHYLALLQNTMCDLNKYLCVLSLLMMQKKASIRFSPMKTINWCFVNNLR